MNNIIGLKPSQPFTLCEPITVDLRIAATVLQKIGNGTFGNCYIALYGNEYRVVAKEMKIIESPKKTIEEVWREASAITGIGDHWGIPLLFGVSTDRAPFYLVLQFHLEGGRLL